MYLQAEVSGFPPFPGVEANYLRAMVARIGHATQVAPGGFYTVKYHRSKFGAVPICQLWIESRNKARIMIIEIFALILLNLIS